MALTQCAERWDHRVDLVDGNYRIGFTLHVVVGTVLPWNSHLGHVEAAPGNGNPVDQKYTGSVSDDRAFQQP
jgi:hypothetical protein